MTAILNVFYGSNGGITLDVVNAYNTSDQDISGPDTVVLDQFRETPTGMGFNAGGIEILSADKAKKWILVAEISGRITDSSGALWNAFFAINGTEVPGTRAVGSSSDLSALSMTLATSAVVDLDVGDVLTIEMVLNSGSPEFSVIENGARITMIGAQNL